MELAPPPSCSNGDVGAVARPATSTSVAPSGGATRPITTPSVAAISEPAATSGADDNGGAGVFSDGGEDAASESHRTGATTAGAPTEADARQPKPQASHDKELSALRVKSSKLERLYMLTKKKLEETQRRASSLSTQLATSASTPKDVAWTARTASQGFIATLTRDVDAGYPPLLLQVLEVDLGRPALSSAFSDGLGGGSELDSAAESAGEDGDLRRVPLSQVLGTPSLAGPLPVLQRWCLLCRRHRRATDSASLGPRPHHVANTPRGVLDAADLGSAAWVRMEDAGEVLTRVGVSNAAMVRVTALNSLKSVKLSARCKRLEQQLKSIQDRHREYRIRSEALVRQTEAQVAEAKNQTLALLQQRISGSDLESQLANAKREISSLTRSYEELQAVDTARRRTTRNLNKELRAAMQASDTWKRRFEEAVREATKADEHAAASASAPTATAGAPSASDAAHGEADDNAGADRKRGHRKTWSSGGDADDAAKQLAELTAEYGVYRKRALEIIAKKDQELQELHAVLRRHQGDPARSYQGQSAGAGAGGASSALGAGTGGRSTSEFGTGASGFSESGASRRLGLRDGATQEYLKNVLMRYMLTSDPAVRVQLESAIAAVMGFSAVEMQRVKAAREAGSSGSLWSKATSLFSS